MTNNNIQWTYADLYEYPRRLVKTVPVELPADVFYIDDDECMAFTLINITDDGRLEYEEL